MCLQLIQFLHACNCNLFIAGCPRFNNLTVWHPCSAGGTSWEGSEPFLRLGANRAALFFGCGLMPLWWYGMKQNVTKNKAEARDSQSCVVCWSRAVVCVLSTPTKVRQSLTEVTECPFGIPGTVFWYRFGMIWPHPFAAGGFRTKEDLDRCIGMRRRVELLGYSIGYSFRWLLVSLCKFI